MLENIFPQFKKTVKLFENYQGYLEANQDYVSDLDEKGLLQFLKHPNGEFWDEILSEAFKNEYLSLSEKNIYFLGCMPELYFSTYSDRLEEYRKETGIGEEIDFIAAEYGRLSDYVYLDFLPDKLKETIRLSLRKEKEYLTDKATDVGCKITWNDVDGKTMYDYQKIDTLPLSDNPIDDIADETAASKVIFLNELGIIGYLNSRAKNGYNKNMVAKILSHITGERTTTLQSYINPLNNLGADQSKSPYSNKKNVERIKTEITQIGF